MSSPSTGGNYCAAALVVLFALGACSKLDDPSLNPDTRNVATQAEKSPVPFIEERQVLFGDLHIHTGLSTDAYIMGVRSLPEDVYTFARGGSITHGAGYPISISRPLDFVAVTDHAEYMGQTRLASLDIPTTRQPLSALLKNGRILEITMAWWETSGQVDSNGFSPGGAPVDKVINRSAWQMTIDAAERNNEPGVFTSFVGYEWSGDAGALTSHMHRNVIYRGSEVSALPFSKLDSNRPEDLWQFLHTERQRSIVAMAIPHNGNFSRGNMYAPRDSEGNPLDAAYAKMRSQYEPLTEILQIKGASETHPLLSSEDEFANFEVLKESLFTGETTIESIKGSYLRDALRVGLELSQSDGINPFKYGVIGSSDSHNASSPSEEFNYSGKLPMLDGSAGLRTDAALLLPDGLNPVTSWGSGGLAAVWAQENTRSSIFDALQRKETYATSGTRLSVRFFGGWNYSPSSLSVNDVVLQAYANGVPMGADLTPVAAEAPGFLVFALKDPEGANLDRAQIVKGWVDEEGVSHEKVFDVAAADDRVINPDTGKLPDVGNTVDVATAEYTNSIGGALISVYWRDPQFVPTQEAFYYARVLEIPTPRWSTFDAITLGTEPMQPTTISERAITSSIWYRPNLDQAQ
ncbi:MAG: DUF3604 domain-containing protein [Gammaproteobacteria bacterium]|jgi:hypothetical protein|nr:DUF3604 domain-containing protein [Gammaproteobacteria bacterium]MBT4493931.1 DUF3604 domain-containing protein [Gammaproteobacteria bacterium]MBT7372099.1 DUF3604 domain-containing protein [Gammaproteobacteria bacterium]